MSDLSFMQRSYVNFRGWPPLLHSLLDVPTWSDTIFSNNGFTVYTKYHPQNVGSAQETPHSFPTRKNCDLVTKPQLCKRKKKLLKAIFLGGILGTFIMGLSLIFSWFWPGLQEGGNLQTVCTMLFCNM